MKANQAQISLTSCIPYAKSLYRCIENELSENLICRKYSAEIECWVNGKWEVVQCQAGCFQDTHRQLTDLNSNVAD